MYVSQLLSSTIHSIGLKLVQIIKRVYAKFLYQKITFLVHSGQCLPGPSVSVKSATASHTTIYIYIYKYKLFPQIHTEYRTNDLSKKDRSFLKVRVYSQTRCLPSLFVLQDVGFLEATSGHRLSGPTFAGRRGRLSRACRKASRPMGASISICPSCQGHGVFADLDCLQSWGTGFEFFRHFLMILILVNFIIRLVILG